MSEWIMATSTRSAFKWWFIKGHHGIMMSRKCLVVRFGLVVTSARFCPRWLAGGAFVQRPAMTNRFHSSARWWIYRAVASGAMDLRVGPWIPWGSNTWGCSLNNHKLGHNCIELHTHIYIIYIDVIYILLCYCKPFSYGYPFITSTEVPTMLTNWCWQIKLCIHTIHGSMPLGFKKGLETPEGFPWFVLWRLPF
jgi:hypothetical protein